jgi:hypothetical protein
LPRSLTLAASEGTTPTQAQETRWSKNCAFRLANSIIFCRQDYIAYYGTPERAVVDARDVSGPWDAIALVYNNADPNSEVDENLLPDDHNVTGHVGNVSDFFLCRHQSTAAALKKHHDDYKGFINSGMVNKNRSGQGDTDAPSEIERLVEEEAKSRKVVADDDNWVELEEAVRLRVYSNPTGNNIISYVKGDIGTYYMWVLFEKYNLTRLINMRVAPQESCTSTGPTRSAVEAGRANKRGTKRAKPADEKTETLKACMNALNTTLKELGSASTTNDSLCDADFAKWAEKETKLQQVNIAHAQSNLETQNVRNSYEKSIEELGAWLVNNPHVAGEPEFVTRLRAVKSARLEAILQQAEAAAAAGVRRVPDAPVAE